MADVLYAYPAKLEDKGNVWYIDRRVCFASLNPYFSSGKLKKSISEWHEKYYYIFIRPESKSDKHISLGPGALSSFSKGQINLYVKDLSCIFQGIVKLSVHKLNDIKLTNLDGDFKHLKEEHNLLAIKVDYSHSKTGFNRLINKMVYTCIRMITMEATFSKVADRYLLNRSKLMKRGFSTIERFMIACGQYTAETFRFNGNHFFYGSMGGYSNAGLCNQPPAWRSNKLFRKSITSSETDSLNVYFSNRIAKNEKVNKGTVKLRYEDKIRTIKI